MHIITLDSIPFPQIVDCFNLAFSDYFVEIKVSEDYIRNRWKAANVDYQLSVGVVEEDTLVGFIMIAVGDLDGVKTAYNTGTGVIPIKRGNGYTMKMYDFLIPKLLENKIKRHTLEVIQENEKAIYLYEKRGLKIDRGLHSFKGEIEISGIENDDLNFVETENPDWKLFDSFHDFQPSWDNRSVCLQKSIDGYQIFILQKEKNTIGYVIIRKSDGNIPQFGIHKSFRKLGYGKAMFYFLKEHFPIIKTYNIDDRENHVINFLKSIGLSNVVKQYEMVSYL